MTISRRNVLKVLAAGSAAAALPSPAEAREPRASGPEDLGLLFDASLCVGCRACQSACKRANGLEADTAAGGGLYDAPLDLNGSTKTIVKQATSGDASAFVKLQCMHCADPSCVSVCMAGALHKEANGVVAYDKGTCVGCRYCQVACPFNVPKFQWHVAIPKIVKCELCRDRQDGGRGAACAEVCPRGAVKQGKRAALLAEAKERIRAAPGRYFEERVYGELDGGGTNCLYLSPKALSFHALGLPTLPRFAPAAKAEAVQHGIYTLGIAPIALYAAVTWAQFRAKARAEDDAAHAANPEEKQP